MEIVNVMAVCKLHCGADDYRGVNLYRLARQLCNVEYNPRRFPPLRLRMRRPVRASFLLFKSGSVVVTGARSAAAARHACLRLKRLLQRQGGYQGCQLHNFRVTNMVGSSRVSCRGLNLPQLADAHPRRALLNQELFNGLFYKPVCHLHTRALLFHTGRVIVTGARREQELCDVFAEISEVICGSGGAM